MGDWIDAHTHINKEGTEKELTEILDLRTRAGITWSILGGIDPADWQRQKRYSLAHPGKFFHSFGLHPWWVSKASAAEIEAGLNALQAELALPNRICIAIGETGLDHHPNFPKDGYPAQASAFRAQVRLALEFSLPLVLHVVRAHEEVITVLREEGRIASQKRAPPYSGIVHSFSGDLSTARAYLDLGLTPSISGHVILRGKGSAFEKLRQTVVTLGATEFVLETDSSDQALQLLQIADEIAALRHTTREAVLDQSRDTTKRIFRIS